MSDWGFPNFDSWLDPDNDPAYRDEQPDDERVPCAECGHPIPDNDPLDPGVYIWGAWHCAECAAATAPPDVFDDVEFDGERE